MRADVFSQFYSHCCFGLFHQNYLPSWTCIACFEFFFHAIHCNTVSSTRQTSWPISIAHTGFPVWTLNWAVRCSKIFCDSLGSFRSMFAIVISKCVLPFLHKFNEKEQNICVDIEWMIPDFTNSRPTIGYWKHST